MRFSWKLGRVAGIDVFLHPTFLFVFALPEATRNGSFGLALVLAAFGCVLLHEFGHALMARQFGIGTRDITLYPIGGVARLNRMPKSPGAELAIALAGPAVNFAIVALLLGFNVLGVFGPSWTSTVVGLFSLNLIAVNLVLGLFNLIPAFPMDGGRVLRALLTGWLGRLKATRVAAQVGQGLAVAFGVYSLLNGLWFQVFLSAFIFMAAGREFAGVAAEDDRSGGGDSSDGQGAPPGYRWVPTGNGTWQLMPVTIRVNEMDARRWR